MRRVVATVVLIVHEERALLLRRRSDDRSFAHSWCLPGGGIDGDEEIEECAVRETFEETRLRVDVGEALGVREVRLEKRGLELEIHLFTARADTAAVVISEEHIAHRWITRDEAADADAMLPGGLAGETTRELLRRFVDRDL